MFKKIILFAACLSLCFLTGCADNPLTGDKELMLIPEEQDIEIGRVYAPEIEKELGGKVKDEVLQDYIDSVGQKIARISHKPSWEYHYVALNHDMINAFALPGGYIFITKGMLRKLKTEAQLAAVLAHETVHVVARDTSNAMSNQIGMTILMAAAVSQEPTSATMAAAGITQQIIALKYSRKDERQADLGGLGYMVAAGYNPFGMVEIMQMLEDLRSFEIVEFFSSHPSPYNRVGYIGLHIDIKYDDVDLTQLITGRDEYQANVIERLKNIEPPDSIFSDIE